MVYCEGRNCAKRISCSKHRVTDSNLCQSVDYSMQGSGKFLLNGKFEVTYWCGDMSVNYPLFREHTA